MTMTTRTRTMKRCGEMSDRSEKRAIHELLDVLGILLFTTIVCLLSSVIRPLETIQILREMRNSA